ncbi:MAG TPA: glycosyltransferase family 1 protein [Chloroflexota bacterium]|nr:glycosyltransferase family 1 protein [Chloroflexota bacterium]
MRVGFNAHLLSFRRSYRSAGISRYIEHTLSALQPYLDGASTVAFVGPDAPADASALAWLRQSRAGIRTDRPVARICWEQTVLPLALRRFGSEILHAPAYVAPLTGGTRTVVTFHDLSYFLYPASFNAANRAYLQTFSRLSARRADRLIAVSEATRQDLVRLLGVAPERVDVVPNGVDERFRPMADPALLSRFRGQRGLPERFILSLCTLEPRKNLPTLIRAYALARDQGVTEPLVLAGGVGWGDLAIRSLVEELGLVSNVLLPGYIPQEEQALWYNAATLFAYPSRYEGFGLPVAEAMACGTPVVTSNRSALPEVVGDAGVTVDPDRPDELAEAMARLLHDDDWCAELRGRGQRRARQFSWDHAARLTVETYHRALRS